LGAIRLAGVTFLAGLRLNLVLVAVVRRAMFMLAIDVIGKRQVDAGKTE
jgi:hypothetical protein